MKLFSHLYELTLKWAKHRYASFYLGIMSFAESIIFPIPPDVMLAPMSLAKPDKAWRYAAITSIASVLGGCIGYVLGYTLFDPVVMPVIEELGYQDKLDRIMSWFDEYGIWVVFLAGFSPVPYKLFTISAGVLNMAFLPFVIASAVSRSLRFYMVAGLMKFGGPLMEEKLRKYIDIMGWALVIAVAAYFVLR